VLVLLVVAVFEWPKPPKPSSEITTVRAGQEEGGERGFGIHAQAGVLEARNNFSTTTSSSKRPNARFCARSIIIRNISDHLLLDKVCRLMRDEIVKLPYVEQVEYRPAGAKIDNAASQADVVIVVDAHDITEGGIGPKRKFGANISCHVGSGPTETSHRMNVSRAPVINFSMNGDLTHSSTFKGIESRRARYKQQSENIAKQLVEAITKQFDKWVEEHGLLPELPEYMYGREVTDVEFEFLGQRGANMLGHGGGLLYNFWAAWSYEDQRSSDEAFREVRDILREQGWSGGDYLDENGKHRRDHLTMSKGNDYMQILRERPRRRTGMIVHGEDKDPEEKLPIVVEYSSLFTSEQIDDVVGRLFASEADIETKLIFADLSSDESVKQLLLDAVESQQVKTMEGYLLIGRHYAGRDEMAKATDALMMARAMSRAESKHNPASNEMKALAKKIGDESLAKAEVGVEYYRRAGFIDMSVMDDGVEYERAAGEPLMFCAMPADEEGVEKTRIKTIALRIDEVIGSEDQYEVTTVTKQGGSSSTAKRGLTEHIILRDSVAHRVWFTLDVEKLAGERFRLTVRKN
jgi:hypothetical protein